MANKNNTLRYRVGEVEKKVDKLDGKLEKIMENELPHLKEEIRINQWKIVALSAILVALGNKALDFVF